jgi:Ser-tRNA(Ala) deacylase AlaX
MPTFMQPLAKVQPENPELTEQFNLVFGGSEMCKAFSELNDPIDQHDRFVEQQKMREAGDDEAQMMDIDYVEALEYAMPPACGLGFSERIFWSLEGVTAREGVPFPQLRAEYDTTTRAIYPNLSLESTRPTPKEIKIPADRPVSAAVEGTKKLYLDDFTMLECDANVVEATMLNDGKASIILDQTCAYPGGGGQACDLGSMRWDGGSLMLADVSKDEKGVVRHNGTLEGDLPEQNESVHISVDYDRRLLNSRLHCAGHILDYAVKKAGKDWKSGKSAHYPHMSFVDYDGDFNPDEVSDLITRIDTELANYIGKGGDVGMRTVPSAKAHEYSDYIPQAILDKYQNVHIATYPDGFNVCCGGTHVARLADVGTVKITKIKKRDGHVRVSYVVE